MDLTLVLGAELQELLQITAYVKLKLNDCSPPALLCAALLPKTKAEEESSSQKLACNCSGTNVCNQPAANKKKIELENKQINK